MSLRAPFLHAIGCHILSLRLQACPNPPTAESGDHLLVLQPKLGKQDSEKRQHVEGAASWLGCGVVSTLASQASHTSVTRAPRRQPTWGVAAAIRSSNGLFCVLLTQTTTI